MTTTRATQQPITTINKKFYAGMRKEEAERHDCYKKYIGIDFNDIDKDKNGVLSRREICDARDKEVEREKTSRQLLAISTSVAATGYGAAMATSCTGIGGLVGTIVGGIGNIGQGVSGLMSDLSIWTNLDDEKSKTEQYRKKHKLNLEFWI